ncbi:hypothetical protein D1AOALGA4SA_8432 [Olavius algarvensis Delta 1 endosymbiont]|nr:hypothetical protein D1AOALGA4SA_8432 [Olavius algarvensis Delta 1 endosymbiont]
MENVIERIQELVSALSKNREYLPYSARYDAARGKNHFW